MAATKAGEARFRFALTASMLGLLVQGVLVAPSHSACECYCKRTEAIVFRHPVVVPNAIYFDEKTAHHLCHGAGYATKSKQFVGYLESFVGRTEECGCMSDYDYWYPDEIDYSDIIYDSEDPFEDYFFKCYANENPNCACHRYTVMELGQCP